MTRLNIPRLSGSREPTRKRHETQFDNLRAFVDIRYRKLSRFIIRDAVAAPNTNINAIIFYSVVLINRSSSRNKCQNIRAACVSIACRIYVAEY